MTKVRPFIGALLLLMFVFGFGSRVAIAAAAAPTACDTVDFYVYNGTGQLIDFESSNWTPGASLYTWYAYLSPGEAVRYTLTAGSFELYASDALGGEWYLDEGVILPACSQVAIYVKLVKGKPVLRVKILMDK